MSGSKEKQSAPWEESDQHSFIEPFALSCDSESWMLQVHEATSAANLAALSRNASVISTSSSDSASLQMPLRPPRPMRTFSAPRSLSPNSRTPLGQSPPNYLAGELGLSPAPPRPSHDAPHNTKARSKSRPRNVGVTVEDFKFGRSLGEGSYSTVKQATHIRTGNQYAVKVLEKVHLIKKDKMSTALAEKNALVKLGAGHPGIVRLYYAFQDDARLYFVIDLARNGEMQTLISRLGSLSTDCARYYAAQIVDALEYMHTKGVIHRDLKPENILFDDDFRVKITDFGTGKVLESSSDKAGTWVGTAQYVSPELLEARETSRSSDYWAVGCILYQMIAGRFAFQGLSDYLTWQKIKHLEYSFPEGFDADAKDLVEKLLVRDPSQRLGAGSPGSGNDVQALRSHPFFSSIDWETIWTIPHPPIEAGLVQKPPPSEDDGCFEDDWDELVRHDGSDDEIEWASDSPSRASLQEFPSNNNAIRPNVQNGEHVDVGPKGEIRRPDLPRQDTGLTIRSAISNAQSLNAEDTRRPRERSASTGSPTSSSENEGIVAQLASRLASLRAPGETPSTEPERGRTQATSPIQGNGPANPIEYGPLLRLPEGEEVLFYSTVEARSLRRRASRILPLRVPASRAKSRELVLTSRRLLCLKHRPKGQGEISIKAELALRASEKLKEKEKEKDARGIIASVERKTEKEFVVLTSSKAYSYATGDPNLAATWIEKINYALASNGRQTSKGRT